MQKSHAYRVATVVLARRTPPRRHHESDRIFFLIVSLRLSRALFWSNADDWKTDNFAEYTIISFFCFARWRSAETEVASCERCANLFGTEEKLSPNIRKGEWKGERELLCAQWHLSFGHKSSCFVYRRPHMNILASSQSHPLRVSLEWRWTGYKSSELQELGHCPRSFFGVENDTRHHFFRIPPPRLPPYWCHCQRQLASFVPLHFDILFEFNNTLRDTRRMYQFFALIECRATFWCTTLQLFERKNWKNASLLGGGTSGRFHDFVLAAPAIDWNRPYFTDSVSWMCFYAWFSEVRAVWMQKPCLCSCTSCTF